MTVARRIASRISMTVALCGTAIVLTYAQRDAYAPVRTLRLATASGWLAATCLVLALCVSPIQYARTRAGRSRPSWLPATRRSLGMAAAICGFIHAAYGLLTIPGLPALLFSLAWLRAGLLTLCILLTLFATSYDFVLRRLRLQHWKELHRLVYAAAIVLAMHVILGPYGSPAIELNFLSLVVVLLLLRVWVSFTSRSRSLDD